MRSCGFRNRSPHSSSDREEVPLRGASPHRPFHAMRPVLLALALAALGHAAPAAAAGLAPELEAEIRTRAAERGADPAAALAPAREAAAAGLPANLVAAKVLEGLAKGAPPPRVIAVARALADRLGQADGILRGSGAALRGDRAVALADLAGALGEGVSPEAVRALFRAAARGGAGAEAATAAARTLGELAHRGIAPGEALALGEALAVRPPLPAGVLASLYDEYRAEGGKDTAAFLEEAAKRTVAGLPLGQMVDHFSETRDGVVHSQRPSDRAKSDAGVHGQGKGPSDVPPGLENVHPNKGKKKSK